MTTLRAPRFGCRCPVAARRIAFAPVRHVRHSRRLPVIAASIDFNGLELEIPDIDGDAKSYQLEMGALLNDAGVALTFGQREKVLTAVSDGVALVDRSHWGRLRVGGPNHVAFLQRLVAPGSGLEGLIPGTGRDVELASSSGSLGTCLVLVQPSGLMLVVPPPNTSRVFDRLDTAAAPQDQVTVRDISRQCSMFTLIGPGSAEILRKLGAGSIVDEPYGRHTVLKMKDKPVLVVVGSGLQAPGFTVVADDSIGGDLYAALAGQDCALMGEEEWDLLISTVEDSMTSAVKIKVDMEPTQSNTASATSDVREGQQADDTPAGEVQPAAPSEPDKPAAGTSAATPSATTVDELSEVPSSSTVEAAETFCQPHDQGRSLTADYGDYVFSDHLSGGDSSGGADEESVRSSQREEEIAVNKWRLIVDRAMLPTRKARVVDIEQIQRHGNPGLRL